MPTKALAPHRCRSQAWTLGAPAGALAVGSPAGLTTTARWSSSNRIGRTSEWRGGIIGPGGEHVEHGHAEHPAGHRRTILLASRSPRRLALARGRGWHVEVIPPAESVERDAPARQATETVGDYAERLARAKAWAVAPTCGPGTIVACDTLGEIDGEPLGKPADREEARRILVRLAGRVHRVVSGLCVWQRPQLEPLAGRAESILEMGPLPDDLLEWYLDSGLWQDKAGACGFQDERLPLRLLAGSQSNVVGLPLELLDDLLTAIDRSLTG